MNVDEIWPTNDGTTTRPDDGHGWDGGDNYDAQNLNYLWDNLRGSFDTLQSNKADKNYKNVTDFGAKGNGDADDTTAIQDAIDQAAIDGENIYLPPGTYLTTKQINVPSNVGIKGAGKHITTIEGDYIDFHLLDLDRSENIIIEDICLTEETSLYNHTDSTHMVNGQDGGKGWIFRNCLFRDCARQAIGPYGCDEITVINCKFENCGRAGFVVHGGTDHSKVINSTFINTGDDAIAFNGPSTNCIAANNSIENAGMLYRGGGIKIHGVRCIASNNVIENSNAYGISIKPPNDESSQPNDILLTNNVIVGLEATEDAEPRAAIETRDFTQGNAVISNCILHAYDEGVENYYGFYLRGDGQRITISDCKSFQDSSVNQEAHINNGGGWIRRLQVHGCDFHDGDAVMDDQSTDPNRHASFRNIYFKEHSTDGRRFWVSRSNAFPYERIVFDNIDIRNATNLGEAFTVMNSIAHEDVIIRNCDITVTDLVVGGSNIDNFRSGLYPSNNLSISAHIDVNDNGDIVAVNDAGEETILT